MPDLYHESYMEKGKRHMEIQETTGTEKGEELECSFSDLIEDITD